MVIKFYNIIIFELIINDNVDVRRKGISCVKIVSVRFTNFRGSII